MKFFNTLLLAAIITVPLSGCVIAINNDDWESEHGDWESQQKRNVRNIKQLELGRSQSAVEAEFGEPDLVESFSRDGADYKVLFYRTQRVKQDGLTTRDETTPLVFHDGMLVGWGESAIDKATH